MGRVVNIKLEAGVPLFRHLSLLCEEAASSAIPIRLIGGMAILGPAGTVNS